MTTVTVMLLSAGLGLIIGLTTALILTLIERGIDRHRAIKRRLPRAQ
jgi:hypothetical protein